MYPSDFIANIIRAQVAWKANDFETANPAVEIRCGNPGATPGGTGTAPSSNSQDAAHFVKARQQWRVFL